jgi:N-acetylglutamate synthase-like GNAT family acetyltransferase
MSVNSRDTTAKQALNHDNITFLDYTKALAHHFESINKQWINDMFVLEDIDKKVLCDPQNYIIDKGGRIWFAEHFEHGIIATCALLNKGQGAFELTKMGVLSPARGLKVGEKLLHHVIKQSANMNVKMLFLLTNAKCEAAIHLYEKNGFVHSKDIMRTYGQSYNRCNVAMRYTVTAN